MSSASPRRSVPDVRSAFDAQRLESLVVAPVQFASFWSAVAMPFAVLWAVTSGLASRQPALLAALLVANLLALRLGQGYNRE
jgi:hypothetical protein